MTRQKMIGLIGGMSWTSTKAYYMLFNTLAQERFGGSHSARIVVWSVDFAEHRRIHERDGWPGVAEELIAIGQRLKNVGVEILALGANTVHRDADLIQAEVGLPLVNIIDSTGRAVVGAGIGRVGLLGTQHTMSESSGVDLPSVAAQVPAHRANLADDLSRPGTNDLRDRSSGPLPDSDGDFSRLRNSLRDHDRAGDRPVSLSGPGGYQSIGGY